MEGRDLNINDGHDLPWSWPPPSLASNNNNNYYSMENINVSSSSLNPRYPSYQNPNPQNYFLHQNPNNQNQPSDLFNRFALEPGVYPNASPSFNAPVVPLRQYQFSNFDQFVHGLRSPENGFSRLNQLIQPLPVPQYSLTNNSPSLSSFPSQNYEPFDLISSFESLNIDDLDLSSPLSSNPRRDFSTNRFATNNGFPLQQWSDHQSRFIEQNHGNSVRRLMFDHLGQSSSSSSSINGAHHSISSSSSPAAAFLSRSRPNRAIYSSIKELRGRIFLVAKDEQGCRFLRKKVDERNPVDIAMILSEVTDGLHELIRHQSANYLIQKLIGVLNEEQMTKLILSIVSSPQRLFSTCDDLNGSRVIQKVLDASEYPQRQPLTPEQKSLLVSALKNITVTLSKSVHGNHVIKRCLQKFPYEYSKVLVEEIAENCLNLSTDRSGCCLLQDCIKYAQDELKGRLIAEIVSNALFLSDHSYGNYVVQYIVGLNIPQVTADILAQFSGNFFALSQGKCSSNVVEKCLVESGEEQATCIINEIIRHPEILELMLHPFGNYVIQKAWTVSQGLRIRQTLHALVEIHSTFLQSHMYGKKVLAKVRGNKNCYYKHGSL